MTVLQYILWIFMCFCLGVGVGAMWDHWAPKTLNPAIKFCGAIITLLVFWALFIYAF